MSFLAVIFKNVLRRRVRSLLTALGIALSVAAAVALISFSRGLENSATEVYGGHGIDLMVVRAGVAERLTSSLNQQIGGQLHALAGVADVNPSLTDMVSFGEGSLVGIPVHGWPERQFRPGQPAHRLRATLARRRSPAGARRPDAGPDTPQTGRRAA